MSTVTTQDKRAEIARLSERKLTGRELARYIWDRAHNRPQCFEQDIAQLIINERAAAAKRAATPPADMEGAVEAAFKAGYWVYCGPSNDAELKLVEADVEKAWREYRATSAVSALQRTDESKGDEVTLPGDGPIDPVADRILSLVRVWRDCPTEKRPSARALAERIVETVLAEKRGET